MVYSEKIRPLLDKKYIYIVENNKNGKNQLSMIDKNSLETVDSIICKDAIKRFDVDSESGILIATD